MRSEAKVGLFVFLVIAMLFFLSTQVNEISSSSKRGYTLFISLNDATGLDRYAKVKVSGVEVGYVDSIVLKDNKPYVTMLIYEGVSIPDDSTVILAQESMLSGRYIDIKPGIGAPLDAGGELKRQKIYATFDQTSDKIYEAAEEFRGFISEAKELVDATSKKDLKESFANLREMTSSFKEIVEQNRENINRLVLEMRDMAKSLSNAGAKFGEMSNKFSISADTINAKLPEIINKLDSTMTKADSLLGDVNQSQSLGDTIKSAKRFFDEGGNAFKKIDRMVGVVSKSRLEIGGRGEIYTGENDAKGYIDINYMPSPNRYYMGSIISSSNYSKVDANNEVIMPTRYTDPKVYYSLQAGKRYRDILLRGGIIESTFGVGIDYFMLRDDLRASFEIFDFDSRNDKRGNNPHAKFTLRYTLLDYIDLYTGVDNFLNSSIASAFVGAGVRFCADDLKSMLGGSTIGSAIK